MGTITATGPDVIGFHAPEDEDFVFGGIMFGSTAGLLASADGFGPNQQNSYSAAAGVEGVSPTRTGVAGASLNMPGVYGQVEDSPPVPAGLRAGVLGVASTQPGVIGFARDGDGVQGASFSAIAVRAISFFGPGVQSVSGAASGVTHLRAAPPLREPPPAHLRRACSSHHRPARARDCGSRRRRCGQTPTQLRDAGGGT